VVRHDYSSRSESGPGESRDTVRFLQPSLTGNEPGGADKNRAKCGHIW
jgi:hypothetical protein